LVLNHAEHGLGSGQSHTKNSDHYAVSNGARCSRADMHRCTMTSLKN